MRFDRIYMQNSASDDHVFNDKKCLNHSTICAKVYRPNITSQSRWHSVRKKGGKNAQFRPTPKTRQELSVPAVQVPWSLN